MASFVKKSVIVTWDGEDHTIKITNELGNTLESININLWALYVGVLRQEPAKLFLISNFASNLLRAAASIDVSQEDVKQFIISNPPNIVEFIDQCNEAILAFFATGDEEDVKNVGKSQKGKSKK